MQWTRKRLKTNLLMPTLMAMIEEHFHFNFETFLRIILTIGKMARIDKYKFINKNDKVLWNEFVSEFYGLEPEDQNNILAMDTDTGTGKKSTISLISE